MNPRDFKELRRSVKELTPSQRAILVAELKDPHHFRETEHTRRPTPCWTGSTGPFPNVRPVPIARAWQ